MSFVTTETSTQLAIDTAAQRLIAAAGDLKSCVPVRDVLGAQDITSAYAVQQILTERAIAEGQRIVGRKIGLTSPAVQRQLGVDQPDFGVLFDGMQRSQHVAVVTASLLQPKGEAEIAFVLSADLVDADVDLVGIRRSIGYAVAALEIVDSRISNWDITIVDTIADNGSSALYVLGDRHIELDDLDLATITMTLDEDGVEVSSGSGAACLGDPLIALQWLARTAIEYGQPLLAGQTVLSGALGPMVPVRAGSTYVAQLSNFGEVSVQFDSSVNPEGHQR